VGLIAALMALSELLRRLHCGVSLELVSGSTLSLHDTEVVPMTSCPYTGGHVAVAGQRISQGDGSFNQSFVPAL